MNREQALERLSSIEKEIADIRASLKEPEPVKPTKEQRFWELINNLIWKVDKEKYPNRIFGFKGDEWQVEYDSRTGHLWLRYSTIWFIFKNEYSLSYKEIQAFIKHEVEEHFKCNGVTPNTAIEKREE